MTNPFIPGPIAPESNPPINPQYYQPSVFFISEITLGPTTTVTTSVNHNYVIGQNVRLLIPQFWGAAQLNGQQGLVISIPSADEVILNIYSVGVDAFISSPIYGATKPQIIAIGDNNSGPINASGRFSTSTIIPGSFINISPI